MSYLFRTLALLAGSVAVYAIWTDLNNSYSASASLGRLWYQHSPTSLQASETIISRYIDPCSLITALDCSPFLWHPIIATVLSWPAALVMVGFCMIFWAIGGLLGGHASPRKTSARGLKRSGEK